MGAGDALISPAQKKPYESDLDVIEKGGNTALAEVVVFNEADPGVEFSDEEYEYGIRDTEESNGFQVDESEEFFWLNSEYNKRGAKLHDELDYDRDHIDCEGWLGNAPRNELSGLLSLSLKFE